MQNHITPSNERSKDRFAYKSPTEHRQTSSQYRNHYFNSQLTGRQVVSPSPKVKVSIGEREEDHPITLKLQAMKEMAMGLLVHKSSEGKSVDEGLSEILSHLKIMLGCVPRKNQRREVASSRHEVDVWNQESARLSLTLARLRDISKSKETKQTLLALQRIKDKIVFAEQNRLSPPMRLDRDHLTRRSEIFEQKKEKFQSSKESFLIEAELKELKMEMVVLRKEKVKLMMELNREIDISNKKSEEIKILTSLLNRKAGKVSESPGMTVDRCRSNPKESNGNLVAGVNMIYREQQLLQIKEKQIISLINQNKQLKIQLKESKQLPFTESFLSDAFNVKQEIITSNKQEYQRAINNLKSHIFQLQNKVDSAKYSSEGENQRTSCEQTGEGRSLKDKSAEGGRLYSKIADLELSLKREEMMRGSLEKQVEFLRAQEKSLSLEITYLKNEVGRLKSPIVSILPSQQDIGVGKSTDRQLSSTGFRFRRP